MAIFGSSARGDDRTDSEIDVLVGFDSEVDIGLSELVEVQRTFEAAIKRPVEVVDSVALTERVRREIEDDRVHAF